ncbi:MAG: T9SS type A sorting domain-containing protein [Bacteroidota bacterium]
MIPSIGAAQVFFTEDFEGTPNAATDLPTGWTESGASTDGIWSTDNATNASSAYLTWPTPANGTLFAYTNDDDCNCDKSNDRMTLPVQNFSTFTAVGMSFDLYLNGGYGEMGYVLVSTNGGTSFDTVYTATGNATAWQDGISVNLTTYAGQSAVTIVFAYNDASTWSYGMGVDDVTLNQLASPEDLETLTAAGEYTRIPVAEVAALPLEATVTNNGVTTVTDAVLTSQVFSSSNGFSTPVFTASSTNSTVNVGDTVTINAGNYTPPANASYFFRHIITSATITDGQPANDTAQYDFAITQNVYARDDSAFTIGLGVNGTLNTATLGVNYTYTNATVIGGVQFGMTGIAAGDTTEVVIYNTAANGQPTTPVDSFQHIMVTAGPTVETVQITAGLNLAPGTYFFGMKEFLSVNNMGLMGMDEIFTPGAGWGSVNGGAFDPIENIGFPNPFFVRPITAPPCSNTSNTVNATICDGDVYQVGSSSYTIAGTYVDTLAIPGGCDSVVTTNLTVAQLPAVTLSGLQALYCDDDPAVMLMGSPMGGTFAGPGVSGSMFNPASAGAGTHSITYTFTDPSSNCTNVDSFETTVDLCINLDQDLFASIEISPNPNNGQFKVAGLVAGAEIKIFDIRGQLIRERAVSFTEETFNLSEQASGFYFMQVNFEGESHRYKVVVE